MIQDDKHAQLTVTSKSRRPTWTHSSTHTVCASPGESLIPDRARIRGSVTAELRYNGDGKECAVDAKCSGQATLVVVPS